MSLYYLFVSVHTVKEPDGVVLANWIGLTEPRKPCWPQISEYHSKESADFQEFWILRSRPISKVNKKINFALIWKNKKTNVTQTSNIYVQQYIFPFFCLVSLKPSLRRFSSVFPWSLQATMSPVSPTDSMQCDSPSGSSSTGASAMYGFDVALTPHPSLAV